MNHSGPQHRTGHLVRAEPRTAETRIVLVAADALTGAGAEGLLQEQPQLRLVPRTRAADAHLVLLVVERLDETAVEALRHNLSDAAGCLRHLPVLAVCKESGVARPNAAERLAALGVVATLWWAEVTPDVLGLEVRALSHPAAQPDLAARVSRIDADLSRHTDQFVSSTPECARNRREADVLALVAEGWAVREVAQRLGHSERTVQKTLDAVVSRMQARNRIHALALLWRGGLL